MSKIPLIVIVGPTSSGKTSASIHLAKYLKKIGIEAEIISADSRQVYKGLDLLSGKVTKKEMSGIRHHMLDVINLKKTFSVSDYQKQTKKIIEEIYDHGNMPILVGGTGFYVDAVVNDFVLPEVAPDYKLRAKYTTKSAIANFVVLKKLDPERAKHIDPNNNIRIIRAIEIARALGKVPKIKKSNIYDTLWIGIDLEDKKLKNNISKRLISRLKSGMIREAKKLHDSGVSYRRLKTLGLECKYCALYLEGKISKTEMITELEKEIWQYVKRQRTWFKRNKDIIWLK